MYGFSNCCIEPNNASSPQLTDSHIHLVTSPLWKCDFFLDFQCLLPYFHTSLGYQLPQVGKWWMRADCSTTVTWLWAPGLCRPSFHTDLVWHNIHEFCSEDRLLPKPKCTLFHKILCSLNKPIKIKTWEQWQDHRKHSINTIYWK